MQHWPSTEKVPRIDTSSRLTGRWEGTYRGVRGELPVVLVLRPRVGGTLDGSFRLNGEATPAFETGSCAGDSLRFAEGGFHYRGARQADRLVIELVTSWSGPHAMTLHLVSADTASLTP